TQEAHSLNSGSADHRNHQSDPQKSRLQGQFKDPVLGVTDIWPTKGQADTLEFRIAGIPKRSEAIAQHRMLHDGSQDFCVDLRSATHGRAFSHMRRQERPEMYRECNSGW